MRKLVILIILFLASFHAAFSQCCSAGNPAGIENEQSALNKKQLQIASSFKHSLSEDYYHSNKKIDVPEMQSSSYDFINFAVKYGITNKFTLFSEIGYFTNKNQKLLINNTNETIKAHGLGDLGVNLSYAPFNNCKLSSLNFSVGTRIPVGAFNEEQDGVLIPLSIQPSSGATKFNISVFYNYSFNNNKTGLNTIAFVELSNTINKDFLIYKYGTYFQYSIAPYYNITQQILTAVNIKYEFRAKDQRENDLRIESTGSHVLYLNPKIQITPLKHWMLIASYEMPVYKTVNGYQLTNKNSFSFSLLKNFQL